MGDQCYCLKWNNYQSNVMGVLRSLLEDGHFVDVTLACEGRRIKAHKLMLSACSNFFRDLLKDNPCEHPIIFLRDVRYWELEAMLDFIYNGQVNVMQDQLPGFIRTAEALQIKGLAAVNNNNNNIHGKPPDPRILNELTGLHSALLMRQHELGMDARPLSPNAKRQRRNVTAVDHSSSPRKDMYSLPVEPDESPSPSVTMAAAVSSVGTPKAPSLLPSSSISSSLPLATSTVSKDTLDNTEKQDLDDQISVHDPESDTEHSSNDGNSSLGYPDGLKEAGDWTSPENLSSITTSFSEGGQPFCKVCGKSFKHQGSLVAHYQVHQQRTKCPVCKKVLSRHYHMKVHLLTVHKVPEPQIEGLLRSQNIM